jgi:hypothetical protein
MGGETSKPEEESPQKPHSEYKDQPHRAHKTEEAYGPKKQQTSITYLMEQAK